jgi:hypothetical protein
MASDRQIAANRRNARKSTGPKSRDGKRCSARNAYQHGLAISAAARRDGEAVVLLAREIAGDTTDEFILEHARVAARAQLDMNRIRQIKIAMTNCVWMFGTHELQPRLRTLKEVKLFLGLCSSTETAAPPATMPLQDPERGAEALRRILPELRKLDRYERRAFNQRDRAIREITLRLSKSKSVTYGH